MHSQTEVARPVVLIAEAESALAAGISTALAKQRLDVQAIGLREYTSCDPLAAVVLLENPLSIEGIRSALDCSTAPALVLAATRELAEAVLPMLNARHDLALATESSAVVAWRLRRLIDRTRRSAMGMHALDALTGLPNRPAFDGQLRRTVRSIAAGEAVGLLMLDLDKFKALNDSLGHVGGDRALQAIGDFLLRCLEPGDLVGRLGGDEFACILARHDNDTIRRDAARLLERIARFDLPELRTDSPTRRLTASAGLTFVRPAAEVAKLVTESEQAMYEAKSSGRNRLEVYGELADAAKRSSRDLSLQHFENSTRLATERLVEMITLKSRRLVDAARQEAYLCPLTGLYSRRYLEEHLPREVGRARSQGSPLSLALIDLDHFHAVNATHGWPTGDRVLQAFAKVVMASVRSSDWTARYGGEEFVIVMPDTAIDSARQVVDRVRQVFVSTMIESVEGQYVSASLSAGVAELPAEEVATTVFVNQTSKALLRAKAAGRNRVETAA